jgi:hypothetical protein
MPMGLCNAPTTFYILIVNIFYDSIDDFVMVYMDDVLYSARMRRPYDACGKDANEA